jgi:hypothetical protein
MPFFRQRPDGDRQKGNVIDNIKLSSFNVEGLRGNAPYLETILPFSNILCLQEHWLWHYEQQDTAKFLKDYNFTIRSSDCNFPKTHYVVNQDCPGIFRMYQDSQK